MKFLSRYLLALLVFNLSACATMQRVDVASAVRGTSPSAIDIGTLVEVETLDGERLEFRVTDMPVDGLVGKHGFVAYRDMARLEAEKPQRGEGKAITYLVGILGFAALAALVSSADTVRICSSPPCEGD